MTPDRMMELRKLCESLGGEHDDSVCAKCDEPCITDDREFNAGDWCWPCCAEFTAAARTAVPELLDEIERLQERERSAIAIRDAVIRDAVRMQMKRDEYAERLARECIKIHRDGELFHLYPDDAVIAAAKAKLAGESA